MGRFGSNRNHVSPAGADRTGERSTHRVLIVDDHILFAEAIEAALENAGMAVVGIYTRAEEAVADALEIRPDLILMDVALPDQSGLVAGRRILQEWPEAKILVLTALEERLIAQEALQIGFRGYLTKSAPVAQFVNSVRSVLDGQFVMPHRPGPSSDAAQDRDTQLLIAQLTARERQVLALLVRGSSGGDIAAQLGISRNTVRTHVQSILTKLQVHSRLEAATFAVRHRFIEVQGFAGR